MSHYNPICRIESLNAVYDFHATVDVLRLDLLHPVVSGNKWFKLKFYLEEAKAAGKVVLTFGGAYSNHIVATAAAARAEGLQSIGIIRGEESPILSSTLTEAKALGMKLYHTSRQAYKQKQIPPQLYNDFSTGDFYLVPEGGYGLKGMEGAKEILRQHETNSYTHIVCAVGTGTTLAGLAAATEAGQQVIGISVLRNNTSLQSEIEALLPTVRKKVFMLLHDFHFGGYARYKPELISFMNDLYNRSGIPTDFVYTGKAFFAALSLLNTGFFSPRDRVLLVHTGGLQGNRSLPKGTLIFG